MIADASSTTEALTVWIAVAGAVTVTAAAVGVVWKIIRPLARVEEALPTLIDIARQFHPNDGKSLVDRLGKVESATAATQAGMAELVARTSGIEDRLDTMSVEPTKPRKAAKRKRA